MTTLRWLAVATLLAASACGDDGGTTPGTDAAIDADLDAPPAVTLTSYVLDLITNQTASNTDPKPFADFESLPDPDKDNPNAYEGLFP